MFSFGKGDRFEIGKGLSTKTEFRYNVPALRSSRSTTFGFGTRNNILKSGAQNTPFYDLPSSFNIKQQKMADSFRMEHKYQTLIDSKPGPGKYNVSKPFGYDALKPSIKGRIFHSDVGPGYPGPGQYKIGGINKTGQYPSSKMRSTYNISFGSPTSQRFKYVDASKVPGPGNYKRDTIFKKNGFNFNSTIKSNMARSFGRKLSNRNWSMSDVPGPGTYIAPSEFGIYISKNSDLNNTMSNRSAFKNFSMYGGFNSANVSING